MITEAQQKFDEWYLTAADQERRLSLARFLAGKPKNYRNEFVQAWRERYGNDAAVTLMVDLELALADQAGAK